MKNNDIKTMHTKAAEFFEEDPKFAGFIPYNNQYDLILMDDQFHVIEKGKGIVESYDLLDDALDYVGWEPPDEKDEDTQAPTPTPTPEPTAAPTPMLTPTPTPLEEKVWDNKTAERIESLHPQIKEDVKNFILEAQKEGIYLRVTDGIRTVEEQNDVYQRGNSTVKGGYSYHNYGLAFDVVEIKDGKALWDNDNWDKIGELGKKYGFEWGGDWESFVDKPHFQKPYGHYCGYWLDKYNAGEVDENGYVVIE